MFRKGKLKNSSVWRGKDLQFQCLEKEKEKLRIAMFGEENIYNSNVWKRHIYEFQCLEKVNLRVLMFGKREN